MSLRYFVPFFFALLVLPACKHEPPIVPDEPDVEGGNGPGGPAPYIDPCDSDSVYFEQDILPLLISNCAGEGCHDALSHEDGVRLYDYNHIMQQVEPGDPFNSDLLQDGIWETGEDRMPPPPNPAMTAAQVDMIVTWIEQGAPNNSCVGGCDTNNVTYNGSIRPIVQNKCAGGSCHDANDPAGSINLTTHAGVAAIAADGRMAGAVQHQDPFLYMPPGLWLSQCEIDNILIWIGDGAPNN